MLGINCGSSSRFSAAVLPHGAAPAGVSRGPLQFSRKYRPWAGPPSRRSVA
jgi:hypothetical protein